MERLGTTTGGWVPLTVGQSGVVPLITFDQVDGRMVSVTYEPECPGPDCQMCNGEYCGQCFGDPCEHDAVERHVEHTRVEREDD